ncbi:putative receptor protein kinase ZmPK1 [Cryptomeria japonica]|uniref:putative receptor protein kinase ZmPK1 n=1 Tax=Cryptomeria japonica TaxID=3369 RepID=UPI0027DA4C61|nr:putative receptor protein kinase ZmPK1 [Cryptomeria japonica]
MDAPWVLLVNFMALICVSESEGAGVKTVAHLSSALLNSPGWNSNDNMNLVSSDGTFCAGFYNVTPNRYAFAVWYADRTLAWMANSTSLVGGNSSLTLQNGALSILDENGVIAWTSKVTPNSKYALDLILQDSGNLVFNQWESFKDFPTFNLLPTQDFSPGDVLQKEQEEQAPKWYWQSGSFPAVDLDKSGYLNSSNIIQNSLIMASDRGKKDQLRRLTLDRDGNLRIYSRKRYPPSSWEIVWEAVSQHCRIHGVCGENAVCKVNSGWKPMCEYPPGFDPSPVDNRNCKPHSDIKNLTNVRFVALDFVNFDGPNSVPGPAKRLQVCIEFCRNNSTCLGFVHQLDKGNCVYQFGKLVNGYWSPDGQTRMYLKSSASGEEAAPNLFHGLLSVVQNVCPIRLEIPFPRTQSDYTTRNLIIICCVFGLELLCGAYAFGAFLRRYTELRNIARIFAMDLLPSGGPKKFTYAELKSATNDFSNIVGKGGFGTVYKGLLPDQRQIAVKKLEGLHHGEQQFWAEVTIIGRIHHLNLVRMWGFCAEGEHRLLVYDYIPNGSLEKHLFDTEGATAMEWGVRYRIALGVARAIAYLHEECLEWVLHCDIKPENILVDENFCPKVSDFGLAKLVEKERTLKVSTVRGTRGYLAPEWFQNYPITAKVDVFSFGMVLFEIVSGERNINGSPEQDSEFYFP